MATTIMISTKVKPAGGLLLIVFIVLHLFFAVERSSGRIDMMTILFQNCRLQPQPILQAVVMPKLTTLTTLEKIWRLGQKSTVSKTKGVWITPGSVSNGQKNQTITEALRCV
jgi:hypothetical protein